MLQKIDQVHDSDKFGRPAGGRTVGIGFKIDWQNGPLAVEATEDHPAGRLDPTGAFVEGVIQAAIGRIQYYQSTEFRCRENALAITHLEEALHWCQHRTADREARGVEGSHVI